MATSMTPAENLIFHRPAWSDTGPVVARKPLKFGDRTFIAGEVVDVELDARTRRILWEQFQIDTPEVPAPKTPKKGRAR